MLKTKNIEYNKYRDFSRKECNNMNMQPSNYENNKKTTAQSAKEEDYSETNKRTKEEFAKGFIKAYDGALKMATGKVKRKNNFKEELEELIKLAEEMKKDAH